MLGGIGSICGMPKNRVTTPLWPALLIRKGADNLKAPIGMCWAMGITASGNMPSMSKLFESIGKSLLID